METPVAELGEDETDRPGGLPQSPSLLRNDRAVGTRVRSASGRARDRNRDRARDVESRAQGGFIPSETPIDHEHAGYEPNGARSDLSVARTGRVG